MRRAPVPVMLALLLIAAAAAPAGASVTVALDLRALVTQADHVVVGRVVRQEARWDRRRRIVTDVTVEVQESMKGAGGGETLVVRRLGGAIGELGMRVEGEPDFAEGERAILFARRLSTGVLRPVGMSQGVLPIRVDAGRELVHPGGAGLSLVERLPNNRLVAAPAALLQPRPLEDVLGEIRRVVEETRGR